MILDQFPALRQLDPKSRIELAFELLSELHSASPEVSDPAILAILNERRAQFEAEPAMARRWEELRDIILSKQRPAAQHA
jgi:hypothetical protein